MPAVLVVLCPPRRGKAATWAMQRESLVPQPVVVTAAAGHPRWRRDLEPTVALLHLLEPQETRVALASSQRLTSRHPRGTMVHPCKILLDGACPPNCEPLCLLAPLVNVGVLVVKKELTA